jgi:hypothetical protein
MNKRLRHLVLLSAVVLGLSLLPTGGATAAASTIYDFEACAQGWEPSVPATGAHTWLRTPLGDGSDWAYSYPLYDGDQPTSITSGNHEWGGGKMTLTYSVRWSFEHPQTGIDTAKLEWTSDTAAKTKNWKKIQVFGDVTNKEFPNYTKYKSTFDAPKGIVRLRFTMMGDAYMAGAGIQVDNIVVPTAAPKGAACA